MYLLQAFRPFVVATPSVLEKPPWRRLLVLCLLLLFSSSPSAGTLWHQVWNFAEKNVHVGLGNSV